MITTLNDPAILLLYVFPLPSDRANDHVAPDPAMVQCTAHERVGCFVATLTLYNSSANSFIPARAVL